MSQDNTSTPRSQAKRSGLTKKMTGTPGTIKKIHGTPGLVKKIPGTSGPIKKISGTPGATKKTSVVLGLGNSPVQTQSSTSVVTSISEKVESPLPCTSKLSAALLKPKTASPQPTSQYSSPKSVTDSKKHVIAPSNYAIRHTPSNSGTNISTGSSSSTSSASTTKARKLISVLRRVSPISSEGTIKSKSSEKRTN